MKRESMSVTYRGVSIPVIVEWEEDAVPVDVYADPNDVITEEDMWEWLGSPGEVIDGYYVYGHNYDELYSLSHSEAEVRMDAIADHMNELAVSEISEVRDGFRKAVADVVVGHPDLPADTEDEVDLDWSGEKVSIVKGSDFMDDWEELAAQWREENPSEDED